MKDRLDRSDEQKSYLNDTNFLSWFYEKYGYDKRFHFMLEGGMLFVTLEYGEGIRRVVTCFPSHYHVAGTASRKEKRRRGGKRNRERRLARGNMPLRKEAD